MKRLYLALVLAVTAALPFAPVAGLALVTGCGTTTTVAPGADPVVVRAEQTIKIGFETIDTFVRWERANEAKVPPAVHAAAESLRREFPDKFRLTRAVLRAYKNNRSPEQKALLETYLATLNELVAQAQRRR